VFRKRNILQFDMYPYFCCDLPQVLICRPLYTIVWGM
jgi:hypothetical protein